MINLETEKYLNIYLKLFKTDTSTLITWYLAIFKELTTKKLAQYVKKDQSTIGRILNSLKSDNLVTISRTDYIKNFRQSYWQLNKKTAIMALQGMQIALNVAVKKKEFMKSDIQLTTIIVSAMQTLMAELFKNINAKGNDSKVNLAKGVVNQVIDTSFLNPKAGKELVKESYDFFMNFFKNHQADIISLDKITPESYVFVGIVSKIRDALP